MLSCKFDEHDLSVLTPVSDLELRYAHTEHDGSTFLLVVDTHGYQFDEVSVPAKLILIEKIHAHWTDNLNPACCIIETVSVDYLDGDDVHYDFPAV